MIDLQKLKDLFGYHRKFSSIQKIIFLFLVLGILSTISSKLLFGFIFYVFVTGSTIGICQYLISSQRNFKFLLSAYIYLRKYGYLLTIILSIKSNFFVKNEPEETWKEEEFKSEDDEYFYDASEPSINNCQDTVNLQIPDKNVSWKDEVNLITDLIQKHFIYTWLKDFDPHFDVISECDKILRVGTASLADRLRAVDRSAMVKELCLYGRQHLKTLQISRDKYKTQPRRRSSTGRRDSGSVSALNRKFASVEEAFEMITTYHIGLYGSENEINYLYSICDILLKRTFGNTIQNCHPIKFLLSEILTSNVFLPLVDMVSEPDFIFEKLILILSDEPLDVPQDDDEFSNLHEPYEGAQKVTNKTSESKPIQKTPPETVQNVTRLSVSENTQLQMPKNAVGIETKKSDKTFIPEIPMSLLQPALPITNKESQTLVADSLLSDKTDGLVSLKEAKPDFFLSCDDDQPEVPVYMNSLEIIEQKPAIFQDVSIIDYEIRNESRSSSQFVLYTIQYDALYWIEAEKDPVLRTREAKRRHREFINLHARLTDNASYKTSLKGIKGPKRWQTLPFGNLNTKSIEERRKSLETYIKFLIQKEDICNGPEMNEFLAYDGNAHIAFVRKSPEINVPRFDKMIVRTMSGMFDEIIKFPSRVSFPSLPGKKDVNKEDEKEDCDQINLEFDIDTKLGSQEEKVEDYVVICDGEHKVEDNVIGSKSDKPPDTFEEDDITLAESVIDIGVQTLQGQDNWVCRERVIKVIKHLIGVILERWLREEIDDLTSEEMCVKYLQLLRETVWPDGELFEGGRSVKTDRQKSATKEQARRCLAQFFPDTLRRVIGKEDFDHGINEIIESLQYKKLNRQLIYTLLDHLADSLYPEIRNRRSSKIVT